MKSVVFGQILLPGVSTGPGIVQLPIQTGTWISRAYNIEDQRRVSVTLGIQSATGAPGDVGGFTGTFQFQGTDELPGSWGATGTPWWSAGPQPGFNGYTGALFWNTLPSGSFNITNATNSQLMTITEVSTRWVRFVFNQSATGTTATGTLGGSGTMNVYFTSKGI